MSNTVKEMFGKETVKVVVTEQNPTCNLRFKAKRLQQEWEVMERHMHYTGEHYNYSDYRVRKEFRDV